MVKKSRSKYSTGISDELTHSYLMSEVLNLVDGKGEGLADLDCPVDADGVLLGRLELAEVGDVDGAGRPPRLRACRGGQGVGQGTHLAVDTDTKRLGECVRLLTTNFQKTEPQLNLMSEFNLTTHYSL